MLKAYVGTKIIKAEPGLKDGIQGYDVYYPDGYSSWSPKDTFEAAYREVSFHERQIIEMTDAEASIAKISDGSDSSVCPNRLLDGHNWEFNDDTKAYDCVHCGAERFTDPGGT